MSGAALIRPDRVRPHKPISQREKALPGSLKPAVPRKSGRHRCLAAGRSARKGPEGRAEVKISLPLRKWPGPLVSGRFGADFPTAGFSGAVAGGAPGENPHRAHAPHRSLQVGAMTARLP